jgi:two-component system LytT family response regulator
MIRCLAIDDEPLALRQLAAYIGKIPFLELAGQCQSALEARKIMEDDMIDAIFVDINMPDLNGMDFVRSLAAPPIVVFTTAYSEYAVEGYKVNAVDYLLKPFGLDDFKRAANKVKKQYDLENAASVSQVDTDDALFFKTSTSMTSATSKA